MGIASCAILLDARGGKRRLKTTWSNLSFEVLSIPAPKTDVEFLEIYQSFSNAVKHVAFLEPALARDLCLESTSITRGELDSIVDSLMLTPE